MHACNCFTQRKEKEPLVISIMYMYLSDAKIHLIGSSEVHMICTCTCNYM